MPRPLSVDQFLCWPDAGISVSFGTWASEATISQGEMREGATPMHYLGLLVS